MKNLHPFPIYGDKLDREREDAEPRAYLFHNGIISQRDIPEWDKNYNDTWHLARVWEMSYGDEINTKMRQRGWRRRQKKFLGTYNKFVLVDKAGYSIINPNAGQFVDGVWHSNGTALKRSVYYGLGCYADYEDDSRCDNPWLVDKGQSNNLYRASLGEWIKLEHGGFMWKEFDHTVHSTADQAIADSTAQKKMLTGSTLPFGESQAEKEEEEAQWERVIAKFNAPKSSLSEMEKLDEDDLEEIKLDKYNNNSNKLAGNLADNLIDEWERMPGVDQIEETIYNYESYVVAIAIRKLLKAGGRIK